MKKILTISLLSASLLFTNSNAQENEISLLLGGVYTEGNLDLKRNYSNFGLSIATDIKNPLFNQIEVGFLKSLKDVDYRSSARETSVLRIYSNAIKNYPLTNISSLYSLIGIGIETFGNENRNEDSLFVNYGFGYKHKVSKNTSFKIDLRHAIETDHADNNLLYTAGFVYSFGKKDQKTVMHQTTKKEEMNTMPMKEMVKKELPLLDDDKDGVYNRNDMCLNSPLNANVDSKGCTKSVPLKINFISDSDEMVESYYFLLHEFADYLKDNNKKARIEAFTDSRGKDSYNQILSQKRAKKVYEELINLGVNKNNLEAIGKGETQAIASNETEEGRAENRRVQAIILEK